MKRKKWIFFIALLVCVGGLTLYKGFIADKLQGIPSQVGSPYDKPSIHDPRQWSAKGVYEKTEYPMPTGKAFKGVFSGSNIFNMGEPGEDVGSFESFPESKVRVQLIERMDNLEKIKTIEEKTYSKGEKLSMQLPDKTDVMYSYSQ